MFRTSLKRLLLVCSCAFLCLALSGSNSISGLDAVRVLVGKAAGTADPKMWARYLIQADAAAEKLEQTKPGGCCGARCVQIGDRCLHYSYDEMSGKENYQHDLLQEVAKVHEGTPEGAEALARLLPTGCQSIANGWTPYFHTLLAILELKSWKSIPDPRLIELRAEAYETWWLLSKMTADDALVTDYKMDPADYSEGSATARERAIEGYQTLVTLNKADKEAIMRLAELKAGRPSQSPYWLCISD